MPKLMMSALTPQRGSPEKGAPRELDTSSHMSESEFLELAGRLERRPRRSRASVRTLMHGEEVTLTVGAPTSAIAQWRDWLAAFARANGWDADVRVSDDE